MGCIYLRKNYQNSPSNYRNTGYNYSDICDKMTVASVGSVEKIEPLYSAQKLMPLPLAHLLDLILGLLLYP